MTSRISSRVRRVVSHMNILTITVALFILLYTGGIARYGFSVSTFLNLFNDNAYLIVATVGIFFVLLTGGIDISIGSVAAFTCVLSASLLERDMPPLAVMPLMLLIGTVFGSIQGFLIVRFRLQPFIVTLAGLFSMRALCSVISKAAIPIKDPLYLKMALAKFRFRVGGQYAKIYFYALLALAVVLIAAYVLKFTRFGRSVYAVGGSEQSAALMGLPVFRTRVLVYTICGFCSSLSGLLYSLYTLAGYSLQNVGMEMDAISSAVIGGTLLTGGVGSAFGTTVGVLIQGLIQTVVTYENLNTWWTKVTIAALLCVFIMIQRFMTVNSLRMKQSFTNTEGEA